ncbi:hypothetical protein AAMO2058_000600800 [Amorphochlora amoebiformis]
MLVRILQVKTKEKYKIMQFVRIAESAHKFDSKSLEVTLISGKILMWRKPRQEDNATACSTVPCSIIQSVPHVAMTSY